MQQSNLDYSFSVSSESDISSLNVYLAEDGGDKTPDVSFNNSYDSIEVSKDEIIRIFHKDERLPEGVNEITAPFCDNLINKIINDSSCNPTNDGGNSTKFNTYSTKKNYTKKRNSNNFYSSNGSKSITNQFFNEKKK